MKRNILTGIILSFILQLSIAQDPGFFLDEWSERTAIIPDTQFVAKTTESPTVTIKVDGGQVAGKVPQYIYGNNAVTWDNGLRSNATAMKDLRNLNPHVLRWPGGNLSNSYFWNLSYGQRPNDIPNDIDPWYGMNTENWQMSVNEYYQLLEETNSTGSICVNYDYARYGTSPDPVAKAAHMAAEWVRYDNGRSRFWEIGNENFGNWEPGYQIDVSQNQDGQPEYINGQLYGQHCRVFIDSMRAAAAETGAEIKIGVVAYDAETSWDPIQTVWNEEMMAEVGDLADFLIVHFYFTPYNENSTVSTILNSYPAAGEIMSTLRRDMAGAGKPMLPVAFTEWNIFAIGSMQPVSYINGMHAALLLGEFIKYRYGMSNRWDLVNGWSGGDDHGIFSVGGEPGVDPYNPRPAFFYMYYFQNYFGDRMIKNTVSGSNNIIAYSSSFSSGETGLVIVNKGNSDETAQVELENMDIGDNYYYHTLTGGTDNGDFSRKVFINGIGTDEQGGGPDEYETIKAFTAGTLGGITVNLPPLSVVYLMVDQKPPPAFVSAKVEDNPSVIDVELSDEVLVTGDPAGFQVLFNGDTPVTVTATDVDPDSSFILYLTLAQEVQIDDQVTLSFDGTEVISVDSVPLISFSDMLVDNLLPGAAPRVTGLYTSSDGDVVMLKTNKKLTITAPSTESFFLDEKVEGRVITFSGIQVDESDSTILLLTPEEMLFAEYDMVLTYEGSGIITVDGGILEPFDMAVTNNSRGIPPVVVEAGVVDYGLNVMVRFDRPMAELSPYDSLFTITVNGEEVPVDSIMTSEFLGVFDLEGYVRYGDTVTFSYMGTGVTSSTGGVLQPVEQYPVENSLQEPSLFMLPDTIDLELFTINVGMVPEPCSDEGGGFDLGYIDPGDWLEYEIEASETGYYTGYLRVAAASATGQLIIQTPDNEPVDQTTVTVPVTGGWQQWTSVPVDVALAEGHQRLRLTALTGNYNLNWLSLEYSRPLQASFINAATNGTGDTIRVEFDKTMTTPPGKNPSGLSLLADGTSFQIASVSWSADSPNTLLLKLLHPLTADLEQITLSYAGGVLVDSDQQPIIPFTDQSVANQVVTSVKQELIPDVRIFPNPAGEVLHIELRGMQSDRMLVRILDITGRTVYLREHTDLSQGTPVIIDTETMKEGLYLIRITCDGKTFHGSVVKK